MKRICAVIAALWVIFMLVPSIGSAQSQQEGMNLWNEAHQLHEKAQSKEDMQRALQKYEQALGIFQQVGFKKGVSRTFNSLGLVYAGWSQYFKAVEFYENSLRIAQGIGDLDGESQTLSNIALAYKKLGQYQKAVEHNEKALASCRKSGDGKGEASILSNMGNVYSSLGQYQKDLEYQEQSLAIRRKIGDPGGEDTTLNNLGASHDRLGQYQKALECFEQALSICRKIGKVSTEGTTLGNMGNIYGALGQYQKDLEYQEQALAIHRKTGDFDGESSTLDNMGNTCRRLGQYRKALEYEEQALAIRRKIGDLNGEGTTLLSIGLVYVQISEYDEALSSYQQAVQIFNKLGVSTAWTKHLIGSLYLDRGELDKAEPYIKEANDAKSFGRFCLLKSDYATAKQNYENSLARAEKNKDADNLFTAYTGLGKTCEALEDYKKAGEYYEKGMKLTEEIRSALLPAERKNFFEVKINGFERSEPAKGLTRVRMKLNQAAGSIDSSEVTRARAFSDNISLRSEAGYSGIPKNVLEKEDAFVSKVAALKKELAKTEKEKSPEKYENLSKEIQGAEADLKTFVEMLWDKYKAYASVKYPRPVTLKESALKPEENVVIFDVSGEGVGVKLIKGKKIAQTFYTEWKSEALEKDVKKFRQAFEELKLKEFDPELGQTIYKKLLLPVLTQVPEGTPLLVIPDGILAILPFEALIVSGQATWKEEGARPYPEGLTYLGDVYPISYYQSITSITLARTLRSKEKPGSKTLVVADPVFEPDDARLKSASRGKQQKLLASLPEKLMSIKDQTGITFPRLAKTTELAESLKKLDPGKTDLFTGMQAKKSILFDKPLTDYASIIFATHGYFGTDIPGIREPVLAMTLVDQPKDQDGFVRMTEVMGMKLNANVVALTACQTGLGSNLSGEGVMSMGRAFQYAGAKAILMSLWSVSESGSVLLVEKFFEHLKEGKNKLDALKTAREDVRKDGYKHPFYWASFILVGEID